MDAKKSTILVADDDKFIRDRLEKYFSNAGYTVKTAKNGTDALDIINTTDIDVLLIDYHMEDKNGDEVVEELRRKKNNLPVIMMTGDESLELERQVREKGVFAYFMKPLEIEILNKIVNAAKKAVAKNPN